MGNKKIVGVSNISDYPFHDSTAPAFLGTHHLKLEQDNFCSGGKKSLTPLAPTFPERNYPKLMRDNHCSTTAVTWLISPSLCIPFIILALISRSLPVATQIRGHIAGPNPPSPLWYMPSFLSREEFSIFCPRRLASN